MEKEITIPQATDIQITSEVKLLADTIRNEIEEGKERAINAMEQEKRQIYWNIGKHIKEHLLQNKGREDYGTYTISQLAKELNLSRTLLYDSVHLYEEYPNIVHSSGQLTWTHMRVLVNVPEKQARKQFEAKIVEEKLSVSELKKLVQNEKTSQKQSEEPQIEDQDNQTEIGAEEQIQEQILQTNRGEPFIYRLQKLQGKTMVDLGFMTYVESPYQEVKIGRPTKDNLVRVEKSVRIEKSARVEKSEQEYKFTNMDKGVTPHYTYKAYVIEVIDGDTIWANIDLGFSTWTIQKLRLRGINAKELETAEGQSAKEYIEARLNQCKFIAVKTYWRDKFSRYLADVFYIKREVDIAKVAQDGEFLNQELLDQGLAVKY